MFGSLKNKNIGYISVRFDQLPVPLSTSDVQYCQVVQLHDRGSYSVCTRSLSVILFQLSVSLTGVFRLHHLLLYGGATWLALHATATGGISSGPRVCFSSTHVRMMSAFRGGSAYMEGVDDMLHLMLSWAKLWEPIQPNRQTIGSVRWWHDSPSLETPEPRVNIVEVRHLHDSATGLYISHLRFIQKLTLWEIWWFQKKLPSSNLQSTWNDIYIFSQVHHEERDNKNKNPWDGFDSLCSVLVEIFL